MPNNIDPVKHAPAIRGTLSEREAARLHAAETQRELDLLRRKAATLYIVSEAGNRPLHQLELVSLDVSLKRLEKIAARARQKKS